MCFSAFAITEGPSVLLLSPVILWGVSGERWGIRAYGSNAFGRLGGTTAFCRLRTQNGYNLITVVVIVVG